jgi:hypothetical protein
MRSQDWDLAPKRVDFLSAPRKPCSALPISPFLDNFRVAYHPAAITERNERDAVRRFLRSAVLSFLPGLTYQSRVDCEIDGTGRIKTMTRIVNPLK